MEEPREDRCRHASLPGQCGLCGTPQTLTQVWRSGKRQVYHCEPECEGLAEGKGIAERKGFQLASVEPMTLGKAIATGLVPCLVCWPGEP